MNTCPEPLKVICIKTNNSTKLIKGATYLAASLHTYKTSRTLYLKDVGNYDPKNFTLLNGDSIENMPDFSIERKLLDDKKDYVGQFVRCRYSSGKTMKDGEIYFVENQKVTERKSSYNNSINYDVKIKIRGVRNYVSPYRFQEISIREQRNIKLKNLKGEKTKTGEQTRKFLLYTEKQRICILFDVLSKVIIDLNKMEIDRKIDIVKLMINKGKNYNINEEDITPFLKGKIGTLLAPFNLEKI